MKLNQLRRYVFQLHYCANSLFNIPSAFDDYIPVNDTLLFTNGTMRGGNGSQVCVEVQIVNNDVIELTESFVITANSSDPNVNSSLITTTVFILDDERKCFR